MKVSLSRTIDGKIGFQNFLRRLFDRLEGYGVKLVEEKDPSDIHLSVISGHKRRAKNIMRIDNVYYDRPRIKMNDAIKRSIDASDAVIFQSRWSKACVSHMLKINPPLNTVINNGIDQSIFKNAPIDRMGYERIFIACAHWRDSKRPHAILNAFIEAQRKADKNIGLFFVGRLKNKVASKHIRYFQDPDESKLISLYQSADYLVHICHLDSCPNSVVEGLSAGCAVLCNNIGGTPEMVGDDGIQLPIDKPFRYMPIPSIRNVGSRSVDVNIVSEGMIMMMSKSWTVHRPEFDISNVAKDYYNFFKKVLRIK